VLKKTALKKTNAGIWNWKILERFTKMEIPEHVRVWLEVKWGAEIECGTEKVGLKKREF
jgi:hypothetical protein